MRCERLRLCGDRNEQLVPALKESGEIRRVLFLATGALRVLSAAFRVKAFPQLHMRL